MSPAKKQKTALTVIDCGITDYKNTLDYQFELCDLRIADKIPNTVLLLEHKPVITLGARKTENKLLADPEELNNKGITLEHIRRGGGTTAHNPGQIIFYPILKLKSLNFGISDHVRTLEQIGIDLLETLSIFAQRKKGLPGLWLGPQKIASIGVQVRKWTTMHGMAININNDLSIFDYIVPCGLENVIMTNAEKQLEKKQPQIKLDTEQIKKTLCGLFKKYWSPEGNVKYEKHGQTPELA